MVQSTTGSGQTYDMPDGDTAELCRIGLSVWRVEWVLSSKRVNNSVWSLIFLAQEFPVVQFMSNRCHVATAQPVQRMEISINFESMVVYCLTTLQMLEDERKNEQSAMVDGTGLAGTATRYRLDGPGIEFQWRWHFPDLSRLALGLSQPPIQWVPCLFPWGKAAGAWRYPPTPPSAEVKERVEQKFYTSRLSWLVLGRTLHYLLPSMRWLN